MSYIKDKVREVEDEAKDVGRKVKKGFNVFTGRTQVRKIGEYLRGKRNR